MNTEILPRDNFTVEYLVIGMYFIFMMFTGLAFRKFIHNFTDYFRSGCRGAWWLVGGSIFMASLSAWTFTGAAGVAYTSGITVAVIFLANTTGYFINWWITALIVVLGAIVILYSLVDSSPGSKFSPSWSALFSVCCASVFSFFGRFYEWSYERSVFTIFTVGAVSFALTFLFWRYSSKTAKERIAGFYRKMHTPVDFEKEVGQANDAFQLRLVGSVALAIAGFIILLSLLPINLSGRLQILSIAGMIGVFALVMLFAPLLEKWRKSLRSGTKTIKRMNS